jgi:hypothetical protein
MTILSDSVLEDMFDELLYDCHGDVEICGMRYAASIILFSVDPIAYRCLFNDWLDGELMEGRIHQHSDGSYHGEPEDEDNP